MRVEIKDGERVVDLQARGYRLIQGMDAFRFGTDSVLLADFAAPRRRERVADLGCGDGTIAFLIAAHEQTTVIDAVELNEAAADRAERSVRMNELDDRMRVLRSDMRDAWKSLGREKHDLIVCNPPYGAAGHTILCRDADRNMARHADDLRCEEIARAAGALLRFGGRFCVIFPTARLFDMTGALRTAGLEPKRLRSVHKDCSSAPKLVLIEAAKGAHPGLNWLAPLLLYDTDGGYSAEYRRIYGI